jgi:hypothetical protein
VFDNVRALLVQANYAAKWTESVKPTPLQWIYPKIFKFPITPLMGCEHPCRLVDFNHLERRQLFYCQKWFERATTIQLIPIRTNQDRARELCHGFL